MTFLYHEYVVDTGESSLVKVVVRNAENLRPEQDAVHVLRELSAFEASAGKLSGRVVRTLVER